MTGASHICSQKRASVKGISVHFEKKIIIFYYKLHFGSFWLTRFYIINLKMVGVSLFVDILYLLDHPNGVTNYCNYSLSTPLVSRIPKIYHIMGFNDTTFIKTPKILQNSRQNSIWPITEAEGLIRQFWNHFAIVMYLY